MEERKRRLEEIRQRYEDEDEIVIVVGNDRSSVELVDEEDIEDEVIADVASLLGRVTKTGRGVSVQASTLGSLEALLDFLKDCKIPVANVGIGPVYKRDVMQCGVMIEKAPDYAASGYQTSL